MMMLMLAGLLECVAFRAYDCNSQSSQIEQYSLLDPEPCGNMEKVHAIERELYGEIVQIKKERLVQVTRCMATQTVKSVYCGWQSRTGPERYTKFHDPITVEPADCRRAAKTGRFKLNGKDYPFKMNVRQGVVVDLVGSLDNYGNCEVGLFEFNGVTLKNQVAGLELKETMVLCGRAAQTTHIKSIAVFFHPMEQIEVASGKFNMVTTEAEFTRLESELSFLQVRSTMTLQETIRQVKAEICEDRKQIAHTRLESIAGAENPYSLMQVFGRGHLVTRNGATVYVTRCQAAEVLPRTHTNCTNEIPAILNGTNVFVDPISFVIKAAAAPVRCNDVAPQRWRLNGRWHCAFPEIRDCAELGKIPMKPIAIDDVKVLDLGLGRSIYSPEQLEQFACFQESQGTRRAFLAESAERAYNTSGARVFLTWPLRI